MGSLNSHYNNFNLLRLFAALQVVYMHSIGHLSIKNEVLLILAKLVSYFPGVPVFFLISGYLITMSYDKNSNLTDYTINRILRIYPALYVNFCIGVFILWYFDQFSDVSGLELFPWVIAQLTLFQFYNPEFIRDFGVGVINGSLWTVSIELVFYISLPFIYSWLKNFFYSRFLSLLSISLIFYYYNINISEKTFIYEKLIGASILPYLFNFLIGLYIYKHRAMLIKYIENKVIYYFILYICIIFLETNHFFYIIIKQISFALLVFSFAFSYKSLSYKLMKHNDFTYGIYIYHMFIINIFVELELIENIKYTGIVLFSSIVCGIFSYYLIEKPFLKLKKKSLYSEINE